MKSQDRLHKVIAEKAELRMAQFKAFRRERIEIRDRETTLTCDILSRNSSSMRSLIPTIQKDPFRRGLFASGLTILILALLAIPALGQPGQHKGHRPGMNKAAIGKNAAMREEQLLDQVDTHKWKKDPEAKDHRSTVLSEFHNHTLRRIVALLRHGALSEDNGKKFKEIHTTITNRGKELNADGELTDEEKTELRGRLNELNDDINANIVDAEQGDERTPLFNQTQHRFEEQIEFGVRSGRLSKGEAATLTRKVEKLKRLEDREKSGGLSTREREKMFEEAAELARDIRKELQD